MKGGLEFLGIGLVDADNKDCVALEAVQTPDTVTLDNLLSMTARLISAISIYQDANNLILTRGGCSVSKLTRSL